MTIHIRKDAKDLIMFHSLEEFVFDRADKWLPDSDQDQLKACVTAGVCKLVHMCHPVVL